MLRLGAIPWVPSRWYPGGGDGDGVEDTIVAQLEPVEKEIRYRQDEDDHGHDEGVDAVLRANVRKVVVCNSSVVAASDQVPWSG
ncbi:MAG: hypothetical protein H6559_34670 [Lewinellaceae bacterium]|nr:hypothetical protein [Lewinellaceae bacterium]